MRLNLVQLAMVFFFVLGALWFGGSIMGLWGFSIAGQGATAPTITGAGACSPETPPNLVIKTKYLDASTNTYSLINTNYYYTVGDETTTTEGTTSSGVATVEAIASCGDVASLWAGDDSTYYLAEAGKITLNQNVKRVEVVLKPIGDVAITLSNSTTVGASSVGVDFTAGAMNSDVKVKFKETTGSAYWGDSKHLISVAGSSYNYTRFAIVGTNVKEVACPQTHLSHYASVIDSPIVKCFEVNDDLYNTEEEEFTLQIYPVAGVEPETNISIGTADYACQIVNAKTVCGYTDYINSNVDIGASDVFVDDAVAPY